MTHDWRPPAGDTHQAEARPPAGAPLAGRRRQGGFAVMATAAAFVAGAMLWVGALMANIDSSDAARYAQTRQDMRTLRVAIEAAAQMQAGGDEEALGALLDTWLDPHDWTVATEIPDGAEETLGLPPRLLRDAWGNPIIFTRAGGAFTLTSDGAPTGQAITMTGNLLY